MGTIAKFRNIRIVVYSKDHAPPHIHAIAPDAEAVFNLNDLTLIRSNGFSGRAIEVIREFITLRQIDLLEAWNEIHGEEKN